MVRASASRRGPDRNERVGLRAVAPRSPLGSVQLDHDLGEVEQVAAQASTVTAGPFDRPDPKHGVRAGELHQLGVALGRDVHGDLAEHATSDGVDHRGRVGLDMGVDSNNDIDHLTKIGQTGHALSPSPDGDVVPVRDGGSAGL